MVGQLVNQQISATGFLVAVLFFSKYKNHYIYSYTFLGKMIFMHIIDSGILVPSNIQDIYWLVNFFFFLVGQWMWNRNIFNDHQLLPLILPSTIFIALSLFLNHHCCLFEGLRETGVFALNISNIGLGFMEIMQLTCVTSWLAGFLYIQVLLGMFQVNS